MFKMKKFAALVLTLALVLSMCSFSASAADAESTYDYPEKGLWTDSSWFGGFMTYQDILQMNGGLGFDSEVVVNSKLGEAIINLMKGTFINTGYDDPKTYEFWAQQGVEKKLFHGEDTNAAYSVFAPEGVTEKMPVIVVFHGGGRSILDAEYYGFANLCVDHDVIVVCPQHQGMQQVDPNLTHGQIVENLLTEMEANGYPIDYTRIYASGHSAGGVASVNAALQRPDLIAAIAPAGCTNLALSKTAAEYPDAEIPMYFVMGEYDYDQLPMTQNPVEGARVSWDPQVLVDNFNYILDMNNCETDVSLDSFRAATAKEDNEVCNFLGIYGDKSYTKTMYDDTRYIAEFYNKDGKAVLVVEGISELPHWMNPDLAETSWTFMSQFSRSEEEAARLNGSVVDHVVVMGDSLSSLAKQYLGSAAKWRVIYEANKDKIKDPNKIYIGQNLIIPVGEKAEEPSVGVSHTVAKGENLSMLAQKYLGDRTKWREIFELNKAVIKSPNVIYVGQVLAIPGAEVDPEPTPDPVPTPDPEPTPAPKGEYMTNIVWPDMFGDQEGALTIQPDTKTWVLNFENLYGAYEISGTYAEDGTMICTDDAGMGTFLPLDAIYEVGEAAIKAYLNGEVGPSAPAEDYTATIVWPDMFGDQEGVLTVRPGTSEWVLNFENLYGAYEISGTYAEDGTMTCTNDAGMGTFLPLPAIYEAGETIIKAYLNGGEVPSVPAADYVATVVWPDMFGDQEGKLTIKPAGEWILNFENLYGAYEISGTYAEDGTMTCTNDAGMGTFLPLKAIYEVGEAAIKAYLNGEIDPVAPAGDIVTGILWPDMFGDQKGDLTVKPGTSEWVLNFENLYGAYEISGTYAEDGTMTCTNDAGMGTFLPLAAIFAEGEKVIKAYLAGETEFAPAWSEQGGDVGDSDDFTAFTEIKTPGVLDHELTFTKLPDAYNTYDTEHKGTTIYIEYTTDVYGDGVTYDKFARVYLPYGYDPDDKDTKYNVLYLQHGNNCSPSNWFDIKIPSADFTTLLDNMFDPEHGVMDPFIIVCPTYYLGIEKETTTVPDAAIAGDGRYDGIPAMYHREVIEDLIPAVESQLNVYCSDFSEAGIKETRDHRAWAGYSRGAACTWYMFHHDFEYFTYWMPTSGTPMALVPMEQAGEAAWTDEQAFQYVVEPIKANPDLDFFIVAQSGDATDIPQMRTMMKYFAEQTDVFSYGLDRIKNNFYYTCADFKHVQQYFGYYLYTAKDILFKDATLSTEITWADPVVGEVTGTMTLDPATETWEISYNTPFGPYTLGGWYLTDGTMGVTNDGGLGGFLDFAPIQAVAGPAIKEMFTEKLSTEITWADPVVGEVTGTLTLNTGDETWEINYDTPFGPYTLGGWYLTSDGSMGVTNDGGLGGFLDFAPIEAVAVPAIQKMIKDNNLTAGGSVDPATCSHKWRDGVCAVCETPCPHDEWKSGVCTACGYTCTHVGNHDADTMECSECGIIGHHTFVDGKCDCGRTTIFEMNAVPAEYYAECDQKGTVESFVYDTYAYAVEAADSSDARYPVTKEAMVYLPYGYDPNESYDILYLLHGGGDPSGDPHKLWLDTETVNMLDNMIKNGDCKPVIVVTPTFYSLVEGVNVEQTGNLWTSEFGHELMNELIPAVETKYASYAKGDVSAENLKATRAHRAYAGLSMGSMTSFNSVLSYCTDYFGYVGSYSAGPEAGDNEVTKAAVDKIAANLKASGNEIYYWFNGNGVKDMAHDPHLFAYPYMLELLPDVFEDGVNSCWVDYLEGIHDWVWWKLDLFNSMKVFFQVDEPGENPELEALAQQNLLR